MIILHFLTGGAVNASAASHTTPTPFHHPAAQIREYLEAEDTWWPVSPEFLNYALALLVYSVRYPAVFWNTNKGFSFLFSLQLLANSFQNLLALGGISIMYKVQMLGMVTLVVRSSKFGISIDILLFTNLNMYSKNSQMCNAGPKELDGHLPIQLFEKQ